MIAKRTPILKNTFLEMLKLLGTLELLLVQMNLRAYLALNYIFDKRPGAGELGLRSCWLEYWEPRSMDSNVISRYLPVKSQQWKHQSNICVVVLVLAISFQIYYLKWVASVKINTQNFLNYYKICILMIYWWYTDFSINWFFIPT